MRQVLGAIVAAGALLACSNGTSKADGGCPPGACQTSADCPPITKPPNAPIVQGCCLVNASFLYGTCTPLTSGNLPPQCVN